MPHLLATIALIVIPSTLAADANPISKVLQMISNVQGTVVGQASEAQNAYDKYVKFCEDRSQDIGFEIKTGKSDKDSLKATIEEETATIGTLMAKIEDLSSDISSDENDLKRATSLREKEADDFAAEESDLKEISDALEGAISHFSKKDHASMLQVKNTNSVSDALGVMVDAFAMSSEDASRLTALVQEHALEQTDDSDSNEETDLALMDKAPAATAHQRQTGGVVSTLEGLLDRAESQLSKVRDAEAKSLHNFQKLKLSLENEITLATKDMSATKFSLAASQEAKSVALGDLDMASTDLDRDVTSKDVLHHECMTAAQHFQSAVHARKSQMDALAAAKKAIEESSGGAEKQTYMLDVSFAQLGSHTQSHAAVRGAKFEVVHLVRKLASKTRSVALSQLASRMAAALRLGTAGQSDPFEKVRGLITNMMSDLEAESEAESSHKEYCDKQLAETNTQQEDTSSQLDGLTAKSHQKHARAVKLMGQISTLRKELASIAKAKAEAAQLRQEEEAMFEKSKAEMQQGVDGIRLALKILKEHYGHAVGAEGGNSIIGLLEVVESDFTQGLSGLIVDEEGSANYYATETKHNFQLEVAAKENDLKHKVKKYSAIDKVVSELSGDISSVQSRLDSIVQFGQTLKRTCVAEPEVYESHKRRRDTELSGLREAMATTEGDMLLELGSSHKLRGARRHST